MEGTCDAFSFEDKRPDISESSGKGNGKSFLKDLFNSPRREWKTNWRHFSARIYLNTLEEMEESNVFSCSLCCFI